MVTLLVSLFILIPASRKMHRFRQAFLLCGQPEADLPCTGRFICQYHLSRQQQFTEMSIQPNDNLTALSKVPIVHREVCIFVQYRRQILHLFTTLTSSQYAKQWKAQIIFIWRHEKRCLAFAYLEQHVSLLVMVHTFWSQWEFLAVGHYIERVRKKWRPFFFIF